jgi:AcrR family transcriptional regulator
MTNKAGIPSIRQGRPTQAVSRELEAHILQSATGLFLKQGYGATSIEAVARHAGISKRTFYHRFDDKEALFAAVVHRLILRLRPPEEAGLFTGGSLEAVLRKLGHAILRAALSEEALGLHRLMIAEGGRFPQLSHILEKEGSRQEAVARIAEVIAREGGKKIDARFAAEQFLQMITSVPQQRALSAKNAMTPAEKEAWVAQTVALFMRGAA